MGLLPELASWLSHMFLAFQKAIRDRWTFVARLLLNLCLLPGREQSGCLFLGILYIGYQVENLSGMASQSLNSDGEEGLVWKDIAYILPLILVKYFSSFWNLGSFLLWSSIVVANNFRYFFSVLGVKPRGILLLSYTQALFILRSGFAKWSEGTWTCSPSTLPHLVLRL